MADVSSTLRAWSSTSSSNSPSGSTVIGAGLDDNLREIQGVVRKFLASKGTAIASAATMDLTTMDCYYASVTGNTTVTGLGTESAGVSYWLRTASTPMFKHGAAAIVLPGAADLTAAAGDIFRFTSEGSGVWVLTGFVPAGITGTGSMVRATSPTLTTAALGSSTATTHSAGDASTKLATTAYVDRGASGASLVLIGTTTVSNVAAVAFTSGITSAYDEFLVSITDLVPATDNQNLAIRVSEDAGGNWKSGASDYAYSYQSSTDGVSGAGGATGANAIGMAFNLSNAASISLCGDVRFWNPAGTSRYKRFLAAVGYTASGSTVSVLTAHGFYKNSTNAIDGVQFFMGSGNITSGTFTLYGVRKA